MTVAVLTSAALTGTGGGATALARTPPKIVVKDGEQPWLADHVDTDPPAKCAAGCGTPDWPIYKPSTPVPQVQQAGFTGA